MRGMSSRCALVVLSSHLGSWGRVKSSKAALWVLGSRATRGGFREPAVIRAWSDSARLIAEVVHWRSAMQTPC
jgi:hypothetical protein